ncbi:CapA family protein [Halorarius litoreus]|uniref:CapA family protein n=1 Tax=Halorarius litoreus TaxID=2962676 RepID=UPI0020CC01B5|nr:CapA family protein [Halorarius litoreus]
MKLCLFGDLFLGGDLDGTTTSPVDVAAFRESDVRIGNLEAPLADAPPRTDKMVLASPPRLVDHLVELGVDAVGLANNHVHDAGLDAIAETRRRLDEAGVASFGAGETLAEAREPYWVTPELAVFGYCEFEKPHLQLVEVATDDSPGVNPLRYEMVMSDLDTLPEGATALLYVHWGREHVWLPPRADVELARRLLEDDRVAGIVGTHAHRPQGYLDHAGKRAYFSLGNFLFPNLYLTPPGTSSQPATVPDDVPVTTGYHPVSELTYKRWGARSRHSLVVTFDTETGAFSHHPVVQARDAPVVTDCTGPRARAVTGLVEALSAVYRLPASSYRPLADGNAAVSGVTANARILWFYLRENGPVWCLDLLREAVRARRTGGRVRDAVYRHVTGDETSRPRRVDSRVD